MTSSAHDCTHGSLYFNLSTMRMAVSVNIFEIHWNFASMIMWLQTSPLYLSCLFAIWSSKASKPSNEVSKITACNPRNVFVVVVFVVTSSSSLSVCLICKFVCSLPIDWAMKCSPLSLSGENGIQWQDLFDEKLNKDFKWTETFEAALGTGDKDALEKVHRTSSLNILFILVVINLFLKSK